MANFDPSQNRNPWADCNKIPQNWLRPRVDTLNQIWYKSIHWELLGIWVKYNVFVPFLFIYLYLFFWDSRTSQTGWWIFTRDSSLDVKSRKDVPFGGLNDLPWTTKISNCYNLKTTDPIMPKFLQGVRTTSVPSWVVLWLPATNPRWRRLPSLISAKCQPIALDKDICTKFYRKMHHGLAQMTMWPKVETGS